MLRYGQPVRRDPRENLPRSGAAYGGLLIAGLARGAGGWPRKPADVSLDRLDGWSAPALEETIHDVAAGDVDCREVTEEAGGASQRERLGAGGGSAGGLLLVPKWVFVFGRPAVARHDLVLIE